MGKTSIYGLGYLEASLNTADVLDMDERRWRTIEAQTLPLYSLFGNGVLDNDADHPSWRIQTIAGITDGSKVQITAGKGHVEWKSAATTTNTEVPLFLPAGGTYSTTDEILFWVYAVPNETTPDLKTVDFIASTVEILSPETYIGLGAVGALDSGGAAGIILTPYNDADHGRVDISLISALNKEINAHHHTGGANSPSMIDLSKHVQGKLPGDFVENLNLDDVTAGTLSAERLPVIDHDTLARRGTLTHPQIDSLLGDLVGNKESHLSDLFTANMLQLALALKRQSGLQNIDRNLINAILYVPGVTPDSYAAYYSTYATDGLSGVLPQYVPNTVTLATIDKTNRQIVGGLANTIGSDTIVWNTSQDFTFSLANAPGSPLTHNIEITGSGPSGSFTIDRPINYQGYATSDLTSWLFGYTFTDSAAKQAISPPSTPPLNHLIEEYGVRRYFYLPFANAVDWTDRQKIGFGFGLGTGSTLGSIYAFLILADGGTDKTIVQGGETKVVSISTAVKIHDVADVLAARNYVNKNLSEFATSDQLGNVAGVGFYWQTASGWMDSPTQDGDFFLVSPNSTEITNARVTAAREAPVSPISPDTVSAIFVWNETLYAENARLVLRYDSNYNTTSFDQVVLSVTNTGSGTVATTTRAALTSGALSSTTAYPVSSNNVAAQSRVSRFIDIIIDLQASVDLTSAPVINSVTLAFTGPGASNSKTWNDVADWNTGRTFTNISVNSGTGYLSLADTSQVGRFLYVRGDSAYYSYDLNGGDELTFQDGSALYLTPTQVWNGSTTYGFSAPRDFQTLANGHIVFADTKNDRVVEITAAGSFVKAVQGNLRLRATARDFVLLTATYNPRLAKIWVTFSQNVTVTDRTKMTLISDEQSVSLGDNRVNVIPFSPIDGKSATLEITLSTALNAIVNNWSGALKLLVGSGALTTTGSSTGGLPTAPVSSASVVESLTAGDLPDFVLPLYNNLGGAGVFQGDWLSAPGLPEEIPTEEDNTDTDIDAELAGPDRLKTPVIVNVFKGEVVFDNMYSPVSVQVNNLGTWIVATVGSAAVTAYDRNLAQLWAIPAALAYFQDGLGGSAYEMSNGNILLATPAANAGGEGVVYVINRIAGNVPIVSINVTGDAVRAIPTIDNLQYWVAIDDRDAGKNSRIVRLNSAGKVVWSWSGVSHPTGLRILPNGNVLVSE